MDIFAMIFAVLMIAAAGAATILLGIYASPLLGVLAFAALALAVYRGLTRLDGPRSTIKRDHLNAFQRPLSDD